MERKKSFISYLRPIIESENERVLKQRERLLGLHEKDRKRAITLWTDMKWLEELLAEYEVKEHQEQEDSNWEILLRRVDMVPLDLALIQAAKESGWGTSRFAREGNNLFGQRCFVKGCGLLPNEREPDATFEVAIYESVSESVRSYINNLNTNGAYRELRRIRIRQRLEGKIPDGYSLIDGLPLYSERRELYLNEIRAMLLANRTFLES